MWKDNLLSAIVFGIAVVGKLLLKNSIIIDQCSVKPTEAVWCALERSEASFFEMLDASQVATNIF
jgi:hypothetical protein